MASSTQPAVTDTISHGTSSSRARCTDNISDARLFIVSLMRQPSLASRESEPRAVGCSPSIVHQPQQLPFGLGGAAADARELDAGRTAVEVDARLREADDA